MANLSFNIELTSAVDANRTLVSNIGRTIIKKLAVKFEGNEIMNVDDFDVFACYRDLGKTKSEKRNAIQQGIISTDGCMENCIKLRVNAGDKNTSNTQDKAIADAYGNKFIISLDFEMLDSAAPYYQAGLENRLCYEITFNDYNNRVTKSGVSSPKVPEAKYKITDISLEDRYSTRPREIYWVRIPACIWPCCMTEFSDIEKLWLISQIQCGTGHLIRLVNHWRAYWFCLKKSDHTHKIRPSFTIPKYKKSLSLWRASQMNYTLKEWDLLSNMTISANISLKESRETIMLMKFKSICNSTI